MADDKAWRECKGGVRLAVRLTPKASRDEVKGLADHGDGPRLFVSVRALPDKGEANEALIAMLAKWLKRPKSGFTLVAGGKSRSKTVEISGDAAAIGRLIETQLNSES